MMGTIHCFHRKITAMQATRAAPNRPIAGAYADKDPAYFSGARTDFVTCLPIDRTASILEIGCGDGATGVLALEQGRAGRYVGVELFPAAAEAARDKISEVIVGDVETLSFDWMPATFDALIMSEVMEHLREPGPVLDKLHTALRPGALVLASSPNVSHWRVLAKLLAGQFPQEDRGVFDRTHLRWFTPATYAALFESHGYSVEWVGAVTPASWRVRLFSKLTRGAFDHLFMTQIALVARRR